MFCKDLIFVVLYKMIHVVAAIATLLHIYKKCPRCGNMQRYGGKKKGDTVECNRCKHKFILK